MLDKIEQIGFQAPIFRTFQGHLQLIQIIADGFHDYLTV